MHSGLKLVSLRECGLDNFQQLLYSIIEELHANSPWIQTLKAPYSLTRLSEILFDRCSYCPAVIDSSSDVIALGAGRHDGGLGLIHWLGVRSDFRGMGLGSELLYSMENFFVENNCHGVELRTLQDRNSLQPFYEKRGFQTVAILPNYRFGVNAIHLIKNFEENAQYLQGGITMNGAG